MSMQKTVMIFGVSSFIGSNLAEQLRPYYRIIGTYNKTKIEIPGIMTLPCDVTSKDLIEKLIFIFKPDITIYCIGLTSVADCEEFPKLADAINTAGVFNVSNASERYGSKFVYFSSCYIFPGEEVTYYESDSPMPLTVYGSSMTSSEFYIQKSCLNYLIFRCCPIFGRSYNPKTLNWMEYIERKSFNNEKIVCDTKLKTGFIDIWTISLLLRMSLEADFINRLFQVSSKDIMTRYEFAAEYMKIFGGNESLITKGDWAYPRSENQLGAAHLGEELFFDMDIENLENTLEIEMPTIRDSIEIAQQKLTGKVSSKGPKKATGITYI